MPSKKVLQNMARKLLFRLFPNKNDQDDEEVLNNGLDANLEREESLLEKLESCIQESISVCNKKLPTVLLSIDIEFNVFAATGIRTTNLNLLYKALLTIPPTSVEAE